MQEDSSLKNIFCPNCNAINYSYFNYCYNCGFKLGDTSKDLTQGEADSTSGKEASSTEAENVIQSDGIICGNCKNRVLLSNKELEKGRFICQNCEAENVIVSEKLKEEEKVLSLLSHLSIVLGVFYIPVIIWAIQKKKSSFVRFHSLQSIFFHLGLIAILVFGFLLFFMDKFFTSRHSYGYGNETIYLDLIVLLLFWICIPFVALVYSIFVAVKSYQGVKFKMPFIGETIYRRVYKKS